jgi:hypothetical protein
LLDLAIKLTIELISLIAEPSHVSSNECGIAFNRVVFLLRAMTFDRLVRTQFSTQGAWYFKSSDEEATFVSIARSSLKSL